MNSVRYWEMKANHGIEQDVRKLAPLMPNVMQNWGKIE